MKKQTLPKHITIGDKYGPAMEITEQHKADEYFDLCVKHTMSYGRSRTEAEAIERSNLGYFAGYCSNETRERVERLFHCAHPIFGSIAKHGAPSPESRCLTWQGVHRDANEHETK